jgi:hypothetical protein
MRKETETAVPTFSDIRSSFENLQDIVLLYKDCGMDFYYLDFSAKDNGEMKEFLECENNVKYNMTNEAFKKELADIQKELF